MADACFQIDKEAGQAFEKAASIQTQNLNEPDDAANNLQEAFKVYRKTDPEDAARVLSSAIQHYVLRGNLRRAATQQQYLAELYEVELGDMKKALEAYEKAAEWFEGDNAEAYVSHYLFDVCEFQETTRLTCTSYAALQTSTTSRWRTWLPWRVTTTRPSTTTNASAGALLTTT
jgi:tetratricopeptide (TPR) repeat protein